MKRKEKKKKATTTHVPIIATTNNITTESDCDMNANYVTNNTTYATTDDVDDVDVNTDDVDVGTKDDGVKDDGVATKDDGVKVKTTDNQFLIEATQRMKAGQAAVALVWVSGGIAVHPPVHKDRGGGDDWSADDADSHHGK
eukprot:7079335-Ditylum_brightwellii.AAC.1